ncbi:MAG: response regulator transcription factor [Elusimicrobia bacterium]|nr:response regulator transcription factor [Elusimicrobiota bacterium]
MAEAKRICLIDDERDFTELAGTLLGFQGYAVTTYNDSQEGLAAVQGASFDAVVVDIMMPKMDGISVMRSLRQTGHEKGPLFALSAKRLSDEERKFLLTNNIHFVQKPFEPRRLVELIREALAR